VISRAPVPSPIWLQLNGQPQSLMVAVRSILPWTSQGLLL
jgi:hypothetical protein